MIHCLFTAINFAVVCGTSLLFQQYSTKWHFIIDWTFLKLVVEMMFFIYHISWRWSTSLSLIHALFSRTIKDSPRRGNICTSQIMILLRQYYSFSWHHHGFEWPKCLHVWQLHWPVFPSGLWLHHTADMKHFFTTLMCKMHRVHLQLSTYADNSA